MILSNKIIDTLSSMGINIDKWFLENYYNKVVLNFFDDNDIPLSFNSNISDLLSMGQDYYKMTITEEFDVSVTVSDRIITVNVK